MGMVHSYLNLAEPVPQRPRICAVSYLNTTPLVWGFLRGPQRGSAELSFAVPSECARRVVDGDADLGLVPVVESDRHHLEPVSGLCIACRGEVRSILLFARRPWKDIETLAADTGSRTSVQLARLVLRERFGADPRIEPMAPDLDAMLARADAALLIGDAALRADPESAACPCLDLGREWFALTGLPMVFAVWAGRGGASGPEVERMLEDSFAYGLARLDDIIEEESATRGFPRELVGRYFARNVTWRLGPAERAGLETFLAAVRAMNGAGAEGLAHDDAKRSCRPVPQR